MRESVCPWCQGNYRWFRRLDDGTLFALCNGCLEAWFRPDALGKEHAARTADILKQFGCDGVRALVRERDGGWATHDQVRAHDAWRDVLDARAVALWGSNPERP